MSTLWLGALSSSKQGTWWLGPKGPVVAGRGGAPPCFCIRWPPGARQEVLRRVIERERVSVFLSVPRWCRVVLRWQIERPIAQSQNT
jgi:hypothetical protein